MNASFTTHGMKATALAIFAALSFSAHATLTYTFNYTDSGPIPQSSGGVAFSAEHLVSGVSSSIASIELILNFSQGTTSLTGNSSGIQGHLILGTDVSSPYINFYPVQSYTTGSGPITTVYDMTFSGSSGSPGTGFNGLNPNTTWGLVLWDNSNSELENALSGWTLNITTAPEPVGLALVLFAGLVALWCCLTVLWKKPDTAETPPEER